MTRTKKRVLSIFTVAAVPLAFASAAFACQALTTASVRPTSGPAGSAVTVSGSNYSNAAPVQVRLDSRTAAPLATATPVNGNVSVGVTIPGNASVGYHTVLITQTVNGVPRAGSPGRASFNVTGSSSASSASVLDPSVLVTPVGLLGLGLLVAVSRRRRSAELGA
jgi:MYXO-CTERM domain-containing protein